MISNINSNFRLAYAKQAIPRVQYNILSESITELFSNKYYSWTLLTIVPELKLFWSTFFNPFLINVSNLYPLKTPGTKISDIFRGSKR